jgi:hypothetical protein
MRVILIPLLLLLISCSAQTKKFSDNYYFPPKILLSEKTYCFVNQKDTSEKAFWKMKTTISNGDTILKTTILNNNKVAEVMTEKIENGNSQVVGYTLYNAGKSSTCTIIDSVVYKFNQDKEETIQWKATFQDFNSPNTISLTKKRQLLSIDDNKQTFSDVMKLNQVGSSNIYEYSVKSIYEKGKGLISYQITRPNGEAKNFELTEIR